MTLFSLIQEDLLVPVMSAENVIIYENTAKLSSFACSADVHARDKYEKQKVCISLHFSTCFITAYISQTWSSSRLTCVLQGYLGHGALLHSVNKVLFFSLVAHGSSIIAILRIKSTLTIEVLSYTISFVKRQ